MKRAFFLFIAIFFAVFFVVKLPSVYSQEKVIQTDTPVGIDVEATQSSEFVSKTVNYELAYPGILPDNPLYIFKVIRDGIVKILINDPFKKAQFSLLNADKRMFAAKLLVDNSKDKLAIETISKSNNYFDDAIKSIKTAKKLNPKSTEIRPFLHQLKTSILKHREMTGQLMLSIDKQFSQSLITEEKRMEEIGKNVESLLLQK